MGIEKTPGIGSQKGLFPIAPGTPRETTNAEGTMGIFSSVDQAVKGPSSNPFRNPGGVVKLMNRTALFLGSALTAFGITHPGIAHPKATDLKPAASQANLVEPSHSYRQIWPKNPKGLAGPSNLKALENYLSGNGPSAAI